MKQEYPKLPKDFKTQWIEALRSGKYKQGVRRLHNKEHDAYCCMGVACRLVDKDIDLEDWGVIADSLNLNLPPMLVSKPFDAKLVPDKLIDLNDIQDKSFNEIADWIEENL